MVEQAGCLQGQNRSAVTHPNSRHARRWLIRLSRVNRRTYTAPLASSLAIKTFKGSVTVYCRRKRSEVGGLKPHVVITDNVFLPHFIKGSGSGDKICERTLSVFTINAPQLN
ncbi:hypothetical protein J6590_012589 [Homalodisca vitripennis]|nr:hypothetical protein J6590_012589 [Homalodisca vitripennis]